MKLLLIDGHALAFRSYYAMIRSPLTNSAGENTSAEFGFLRTLLALRREQQPDAILVAFDPPGGSFRHRRYPEYKAKRAATPPELKASVEHLQAFLPLAGIAQEARPGYEADDLIASAARQAAAAGWQVLIASADKDLCQLVDERIRVLRPAAGVKPPRELGPREVEEEFGVPPAKLRDYLSLTGDDADNVPGVPGRGPQGRAKLLAEFLGAGEAAAPVAYHSVEAAGALAALGARLAAAPRFAVDTETTGLDPLANALVGISVALVPGEAWYLPVAGRCAGAGLALADLQAALGPVLAGASTEKIAQNLKFDAQVLARHGLAIAGPTFDTMLASYCVDPGRRSHGLDALALELLGHVMVPYDALFAAGDKERDITRVPLDKLTHYAAEDADYTLRLAEHLRPALVAAGVESLFRELEMPLLPVLAAMEAAGIGLDTAHLAALGERMEAERTALEARIHEAAGKPFAIGSPKQLAAVLFEELKLPSGRKTKTGFSTDEQVLGELAAAHPIAGWVLEWRELAKLKSTYVDVLPTMVLPSTGRVHTRFNQAVAATGRLSSSDPNLQNIPIRSELGKEIRRAFVPAPGLKLASFDYSQVELRILAALSEDAALSAAFAADRDIHRWTAARLASKPEAEVSRDERDRAKTVNFGVLYGMGAHGLAQRLRIPRTEAQRFIDEYFAAFPGVRRWIDATLLRARAEGSVSTILGRRRALPELNSANPALRAFGERVAINTPIQGSAADLIKLAMLRIHAWLATSGLAARMLLQVHDELLFEAPPAELDALAAGVIPLMEKAGDLAVPLKVEWGAGDNWLEAH